RKPGMVEFGGGDSTSDPPYLDDGRLALAPTLTQQVGDDQQEHRDGDAAGDDLLALAHDPDFGVTLELAELLLDVSLGAGLAGRGLHQGVSWRSKPSFLTRDSATAITITAIANVIT